ncbi:MAG: tetratricopeptide repeat protein [Pseudomonadales bacterium]
MNKQQVYALYSEMLDLPSDQREATLQARCAGNVVLLNEVRELLDAAEQPDTPIEDQFAGVLEDYWRSVVDGDDRPEEDLVGHRIDHWLLTEQVGRGGLATVYRASRDDGMFQQTAAIKILRRGLDTDDLISRFRAEREILSSLEHPGIARILDGGTLDDGRPYLAMEFVDGTDIVSFAEDRQLSQALRLGLVRDIANVLHHAHQRLIVHRDIKPSNVLVTDDGQVRLLDFGIAKILDPSNSPLAAQLTRTGIALMTPAYGSPEQYRQDAITTASDTYQLGLLMAQLLTGRRPNTDTSDVLERRAPQADLRGIDDKDILAILQMATRAEPEQRYPTILDFALDLDRLLANKPIHARPDSFGYRLKKFAQRRPSVIPAALAAGAAVLIYVVTITNYARELEHERQIATQTQNFMIDMFKSPDPRAPADVERGRNLTVVEALKLGEQRTLTQLETQPELQASLSRAIAGVYEALGQYDDAIRLMTAVVALDEAQSGAEGTSTLASMRKLAQLHRAAGDLEEAARLSATQLERTQTAQLGNVDLGMAEHDAALQARAESNQQATVEGLESAINTLLAEVGNDVVDKATITELLRTGATASDPKANILALEKLSLTTFGADSVQGLVAQVRTAGALAELDEFALAEQRLVNAIPKLTALLGATHPTVLDSRNNLAITYSSWQKLEQAEQIHRQLLEDRRLALGPDSHDVAISYQNLATAIVKQGRLGEALALYQQTLRMFVQLHGENHRTTALPLISMSALQLQADVPADAETLADRALASLPESDQRMRGIANCLKALAETAQHKTTGTARLAAARVALAGQDVPPRYAALCGLNPAATQALSASTITHP